MLPSVKNVCVGEFAEGGGSVSRISRERVVGCAFEPGMILFLSLGPCDGEIRILCPRPYHF